MLDFDYGEIPRTGRFGRWIARGIRQGPDPFFRYRCACFSDRCRGSKVTSALISGAKDKKEDHLVRGMCLESLAHKVGFYKARTKQDRKIYRVVLESLRDPHPNVRFWACFAAGQLRLRAAQSALRELSGDQGLGCMGWTVDYEAGEALKSIRGEPAWEGEVPQGKCPYPPLW